MEKHNGICKLCGDFKSLNYEHIPPKKANNKGRFVTVPFDAIIKNPFVDRPKGKKNQGGIGYYALCETCNGFTGRMYANAYIDFVNQVNYRHFLSDTKYLRGDPYIIQPLKVLKQIISNLICISSIEYHNVYPELIDFVLNKESRILPDKYQIFAYYNLTINKYRYLHDNVILSENGLIYKISEVAYPPLGFLLSIDNPKEKIHPELFNLTYFKNFDYFSNSVWLNLKLKVLPVEIPGIPADYRSRAEIEAAMKLGK